MTILVSYRHFPVAAVLLLLCLAAASSTAETVVFEATYKARYAGLNINTERRLVELDDGSYRLESEASNFLGSLKESSHFTVEGELWRPLSYSYRRRIFGSRTTEAIEFDWDTQLAHYTHSDKPERNSEHHLTAGVLDPALYQLRMQRDLVLGLEHLEYYFIKRDSIRHYHIKRGAREDLKIGKTTFKALRMYRADSDDDKQTYVWTLPELHHLFGKIVHVEDGDDHQLLLVEHKANPAAMEAFFTEPRQQQAQ